MEAEPGLVELDVAEPVWPHFFTVAPLVLVGTREEDGSHNLAPKHMALPLGWENFWGFVCAPRHRTYHNAKREEAFTVTYPRPNQVLLASLAAAPRDETGVKLDLASIDTFSARQIDGVFMADGYLFLECELERIVEGFGENILIAGRVVAAYVQKGALLTDERDANDALREEPVLAYLDWGRFTAIREGYAFPFPIGFER